MTGLQNSSPILILTVSMNHASYRSFFTHCAHIISLMSSKNFFTKFFARIDNPLKTSTVEKSFSAVHKQHLSEIMFIKRVIGVK
jgi:hypothetical protein